ncbi:MULTISPECIES: EFR1 family ferrodoxin [unclassified Oceanispirochaeta]|uniref:EFR1 family ferrodoxin n=1 Tax=unclassified Oceanispirochaeta TaxID=2635722 RepID=UPI000E09D0D7|nr:MULTISPECIES: EFR1 family ferrodoxin [unclassified Oceanispirochaeta]MBF9014021.1 EFR1 family ferrodoxin [Oceanispirochaeta sp. M2]NPD70512.1 4Fe-4S dicluster domain-containing protein [Oceanispirochaeta sp. M1]RDG34281.1 4Fe-4S dicluster domain-containing protein [Oceanispirochaeta sp. M1]
MNKISIFYFSGTGNTKYVSHHLAELMKGYSWDSTIVSITKLADDKRDELIKNSDVLILAHPVYGSDMPDQMRDFINFLPDANGQKLGVIATQMMFSGDGSSIMYKVIKKKGYKQNWGYQINMPNNLPLAGSPLFQSADYEVHEKKHLRKARRTLEKLAMNIVNDKRRIGDNTPFHTMLGLSQRPLFQKKMKREYQTGFIADEKCISCMKCVNACPAEVIQYNDKIEFTNTENCQVCFRCLNFCPVSAISQNGKLKEPLYKGPAKEIFKELF